MFEVTIKLVDCTPNIVKINLEGTGNENEAIEQATAIFNANAMIEEIQVWYSNEPNGNCVFNLK